MSKITFKTCESVCEGHPDKICDQISDAVLDACLQEDGEARVAIECLIKDNNLVIAGEITTTANPDYNLIARETLKQIGYTAEQVADFQIQVLVGKQSPSIALGVDTGGAGDQGMMYGYATNETKEMIPLPLLLAHQLCWKLAELRKANTASILLPDGKAQVTIRYENNRPIAIEAIVVSAQHRAEVTPKEVEDYVFNEVIKPVCGQWLKYGPSINPHFGNNNSVASKIYINPTGRFEIGGSYGDCGVTGRKIAVDTYGGIGRIGGGAFSGKDPSKVDRSAAYMARLLAKKLVTLGYGEEVEVRLAYVIGVAGPVDVSVNIISGDQTREVEAVSYLLSNFDLTPRGIIKLLNLKQPIFQATASYGHFGRPEFSWEGN